MSCDNFPTRLAQDWRNPICDDHSNCLSIEIGANACADLNSQSSQDWRKRIGK
jgi:hypothetical protein